MRNGKLNKQELARVARCYRDLDGLQAAIPSETSSDDEKCTLENLVDSRNKLGKLLRWQDYNGAWQEAKGGSR